MSAAVRGPWGFLWHYRTRIVIGCALLVVTNAFALTIPWLLGRIIEALSGPDPADAVPPLAMAMIACAVIQATVRIGSRVALFNAARMAEADLRSQLFEHLLTLEPAYYRQHPVGDVMSRLTSDIQTVRGMWGPGLLNLVNTTVLFSVALVLMLGIDPWLTLWALLPYPMVVVVGTLFGKRIYKHSSAVQRHLGTLSSRLQEDLSGIAVIKTYSLEGEQAKHFSSQSEKVLEANMGLTKVRGQLIPVLGAVSSLGTVIVLFIGGRSVIDGDITLGQLIQFNAYLALLVWPTMALGWMISLLQRGKASWSRLSDIFERQPAIRSGGAAMDVHSARGAVEVRNLSLEIDGQRLLHDVSLALEPGTTTAIVGRLGSGKSLLVEALPRLLDVPAGSVFIDGVDITTLDLSSLRGLIGYAPQDAFLFSATIADNIAVGLPNGGESMDADERLAAITRAADAAGLSRDLGALPAGLATTVGERGITLSGGQRQRVALARALATERPILVLDDSLSSVDAETERDILGHLDSVLHNRTAVLISHRLAAVRRADRIAVIDRGRLVELGQHDELMALGGVYADLYRTQLAEEAAA